MSKYKFVQQIVLILIALGLSACGQSGALKLPPADSDPPSTQNHEVQP
jgi:predicted small lipoprotein YifL